MRGPLNGLMLTSSGFIWPQLRDGVGPVTLWQTIDGGTSRYANALIPVISRPTISVCIVSVPS
jgi:hypothetical protein